MTSEILQSVHADHFFGPPNGKRFRVRLAKEFEKAFWFAQVLVLYHLNTVTYHEMSREFAFLRYIETILLIDTVDRALSCLCLRLATGDKCDPTVNRNLRADNTIDVGECYDVVSFNPKRSAHHIVISNYSISSFAFQLP